MAVDRVNLVREGFEAWNGTYKGVEGVQEFWSRWRNAVGQLKFAAQEMIDGGDHIVVIAHRWARNDITGLQISDKIAQVFSFDDQDKCVRVQEFYDRGTAMKAAGLE